MLIEWKVGKSLWESQAQAGSEGSSQFTPNIMKK
jgi:hypothetical protein